MPPGGRSQQHRRERRRGLGGYLRPGRLLHAVLYPSAAGARGLRPGAVRRAWLAALILALLAGVEATTPSVPQTEAHAPSTPAPTGANATLPKGDDIREKIRAAQAGDNDQFYVCPPPSGATVVRVAPPKACPKYDQGRNFTEGIGVLFKENIAPYKFKAHIYYKNVIVTTTWSGSSYAAITNQYADRVPVKVSEVTDLIDKEGKCLSKAVYVRSNREVTAFDRDADAEKVTLKASKFNTNGARGWHTTRETHVVIGSPGFYRTGTSVNCIVEEVDARSLYPYDSFALSTGDIIYMSPFYGLINGSSREHTSYAPERFKQVEEYQTRDLDTNTPSATKVTRNFLTTQHVTVAWNWVPKQASVCSLTKWREVEEMIRDASNTSYRFTAKDISSTFVGSTTPFNINAVHLSECVEKDANASVARIYSQRYNGTHVRVGRVQLYLVRGGFILAFQALMSNELAELYRREHAWVNGTASISRVRRSSSASSPGTPQNTTRISTTTGAEFAALQFTYNHIQSHVNEMFARIATAWCVLQNKELALWKEMVKLNPSAAASAMLDRRVSGRLLGDIMAVSSCVPLNGSNVYIQNSMRTLGSLTTCYSRPLVSFSYGNTTGAIEGQLGEDNELLIDRPLIEPCTVNHKRYFRFGSTYVYYEDYAYVRTIPAASVETISAYVDLNIVMLEDREFMPMEVYTRAELADTGLLDYSEIQRRNQLHALKFYDIDTVVKADNNLVIMRGMADFFQGLGAVGKAVGSVVMGAAGLAISTVTGIASFLSNPFGALAIGLLVLAGLVAAFLAYRYVMRIRNNPMKALYPVTTKSLKDDALEGGDAEEFDEKKLEDARDMIRYMTMVSAMERQEHKARKKNKGPGLINARVLDMVTRRRRGGGPRYQRLAGSDDEAAADKYGALDP
nr:envelope glycoprotein B [Monodontid alphaherpesvirus 2]